MYRNFKEIEDKILPLRLNKRVALAGGHDTYSLKALIEAKKQGLVTPVLIGETTRIEAALAEIGETSADYEIIGCEGEANWGKVAVDLIQAGQCDMYMKGLMQTMHFMRPMLALARTASEKEQLVSVATIFEHPEEDRLFMLTDCAVNIAPDLEEKKKIILNAVHLAHSLGIQTPKVAVLSAIEFVNPKIPSSVDADLLKKAWQNGEIPGCIVGGPFGFDNAVSASAASHKSVTDPVAGHADILVVPDLDAGNMLTKSLLFFAHLTSAGAMLGTNVPVIAASRTDAPENKYRAIFISLLMHFLS